MRTGGPMSSGVTQVALPDGTLVWARISDIEQLGLPDPTGSNYVDTGFADQAAARLESLRDVVTGVAASVADGLHAARPDKVSVTFGIELTAKAGKVIGLLAEGEAKGAISVTLTWRGAPPTSSGQAE